jgi:NAD(P)H:quinone oxidoreductase type IV
MATRIQVVFYSMYGHVYRLAEAVSAGAREVAGTEVSVYQVPELVPDDILEKSGANAARTAFAHVPVAKPEKLADADAIIFGTPTRFGNMCAQMRNFLNQTGEIHFLERHHIDRFVALMDNLLPRWTCIREALNAEPLGHGNWP